MRLLSLLVLLPLASVPACRSAPDPAVVETDSTLALGSAELQTSATRTFSVGGRTILFTRLDGTAEIEVRDTAEAALRFTERIAEGRRHDANLVDILSGPQVRFTVERGRGEANPVDVRGVVPKGTPLMFRMENGTVVVRNPDARVSVRMVNGTVQVTGATGELSLDVDNGTVDATLAALTAPQHLRTRNGSIALYLPPTASANVSLRSGVRIDVEGLDLPPPVDGLGTQRLTGGLGAGEHLVSVLATNGSIFLGAYPRRDGAVAPMPGTPGDTAAAR